MEWSRSSSSPATRRFPRRPRPPRRAPPPGAGQRDQHDPCVEQLAQPARDELEQRRQLQLGSERVADLVQRLELAQPARRRLVQTCVLDRDGGLRGEQLRQLEVLVRERPRRLPSRSGRGSRTRRRAGGSGTPRNDFIGGWLRGKPTERGSVAMSSSRSGCASRMSTPRIPRPRGSSPIAACVSVVDSGREEALERLPALVDHAERGVASAGHLGRGLDEPLEQRVQRELGVECDARVEKRAQPVGDVGHGAIIDRALCCVQERRSGRRASAASSSRPPSCEVDVRRAPSCACEGARMVAPAAGVRNPRHRGSSCGFLRVSRPGTH